MPEPSTPSFDAVLLIGPAAAVRVGGLTLLERAAFTVARAGAARALCVGERPLTTLHLPRLAITWSERPDDPVARAWIAAGTADAVLVVDATVLAMPEAIATLLATPLAVAVYAPLAATLWRLPSAGLLPALAHLHTGGPPSDARPCALSADSAVVIHDRTSAAAAERALFARLGRPGEGWFARAVDRRLSRALTRLLVPTGVTPNQVTAASITLGVVAGLVFAVGSPVAQLAAAVLFFASTIIDGCDGEIARLTFRESELGAQLDVIGDNVVHLALFAGIAVGIHRHAPSARVAVLGCLLVGGALLAMATAYACLIRRRPTPAQRAFFDAFASREFAYLLLLLTALGKLEWFLWMAALGTYAFALGLLVLGNRALRTPSRSLPSGGCC